MIFYNFISYLLKYTFTYIIYNMNLLIFDFKLLSIHQFILFLKLLLWTTRPCLIDIFVKILLYDFEANLDMIHIYKIERKPNSIPKNRPL